MRKLLRGLFNKLGYDIVKINMHSSDKAGKTVLVKVGNYTILMPGNNPQISLYKYSPDSNSQLGRLTKLIASKYKDASLIDIGANVGDTIAAIRTHTNIPVIAIEGDDTSFSFLQRNVTQFQDIIIIKQYLGEDRKELAVSIEKGGWNNTIIPDKSGEKKIDIKTLDEIIADNNLGSRNIKLIKIDTEGFDTIILRGCRQTITDKKPVLYFEYNGENMNAIGENGLSTLLSLKNFGYNAVQIYDCVNNLLIATTLDNKDTLEQLHKYIHKSKTMIPYLDICVFHSSDNDMAASFRETEQ
ncbi:MAG: FkbM family methyltransferase [Ferruginibacter sp.]